MGELNDFDNFFYYGENDIALEVKSDVMAVIFQPVRSLFYNRNLDSAGIDRYENNPNTINLSIIMPYAVMSALSQRNYYVSNGENNTRDRRAFTSQSLIRVEQSGSNLDMTIPYIPGYDLRQSEIIKTTGGI